MLQRFQKSRDITQPSDAYYIDRISGWSLSIGVLQSFQKAQLFIFSEMINIKCYIYGIYVCSAHNEIFLILSVACTCSLQLVGSSKLRTTLLIFKLIFKWYILPILQGYKEMPDEQSSYTAGLFIFTVVYCIHYKKISRG